MNNQKKWYKSKTVWSGIAKVIAGLFVSVSGFLAGDVSGSTLTTGLLTTAWGIYDIILRFQTNQIITK